MQREDVAEELEEDFEPEPARTRKPPAARPAMTLATG